MIRTEAVFISRVENQCRFTDIRYIRDIFTILRNITEISNDAKVYLSRNNEHI